MTQLQNFIEYLQNQLYPPRPGLIWKPQTHRWIRPEKQKLDLETKKLFREAYKVTNQPNIINHILTNIISGKADINSMRKFLREHIDKQRQMNIARGTA